jgi:hypothetical protein
MGLFIKPIAAIETVTNPPNNVSKFLSIGFNIHNHSELITWSPIMVKNTERDISENIETPKNVFHLH